MHTDGAYSENPLTYHTTNRLVMQHYVEFFFFFFVSIA